VLRRIGREKNELLKATAAPALNAPVWLWDSWVKAYGETRARGIALAHLADPPLDFSVKAEPENWAQQLGATILPTGSLRRTDGGSIETLPGFADGPGGSGCGGGATGDAAGAVAGKTVIDLCAAPGGKTAQLAAAGAPVTAVDRSAKRLERLTANLTAAGSDGGNRHRRRHPMAASGAGRCGAAGCACFPPAPSAATPMSPG
jgi:16S rRNA (cytosine967-C5)-methyltransferase